MRNSKMDQIAKIFNKQLGEVFVVDDYYGIEVCRFNSIMLLHETPEGWECADDILLRLLNGRAEVQ